MAVLLWAQAGWACIENPLCLSDGSVTLAPTYTTEAIWLGSTSYYINKSIGAADTEEKSVQAPSSLGVRGFQYRFEANQRAMRDGLLRASGVEFNWVVGKLLEASPVKQPLFRCVLIREHSTLNGIVSTGGTRLHG